MTDTPYFPDLETVGTAPMFLVARWYTELPQPRTDEEKDVIERICMRCEGCNLLETDGTLKKGSPLT